MAHVDHLINMMRKDKTLRSVQFHSKRHCHWVHVTRRLKPGKDTRGRDEFCITIGVANHEARRAQRKGQIWITQRYRNV
jgi:hypothetical protein